MLATVSPPTEARMSAIEPTPRTTLVRRADRGTYERATVNAILDEALICHVGFVMDGQPFVLPTTHARIDDRLYIHGSAGGRMLRSLRRGTPVCVTVTLLDGLVPEGLEAAAAVSAFAGEHGLPPRAADEGVGAGTPRRLGPGAAALRDQHGVPLCPGPARDTRHREPGTGRAGRPAEGGPSSLVTHCLRDD